MPAPVSIVIPTLDAGATLPATLAGLFPGVAASLIREVIVSDGGSTDATCAIAEDAGAEVVTGASGRGAQLARGAERAVGDWLLFLHADSRLSEDWVAAVADRLRYPDTPACFRLAFDARGIASRLVAGGANLRTRALSLPYGDQGLLISRRLYRASGGYPEIPLMEDVAIARRLPRVALMDATLTTSAARYERNGWARQSAANLLRLARYRLGASPESLARTYR